METPEVLGTAAVGLEHALTDLFTPPGQVRRTSGRGRAATPYHWGN